MPTSNDVHALHERIPLKEHISIDDYAGASTGGCSDSDQSDDAEQDSESPPFRDGGASVLETMTNLAKTCMGTGCLALPYAAQKGGILLYVAGLLAIALWNVYASQRLAKCWDLLTRASTGSKSTGKTMIQLSPLPQPPRGTATLGAVAWYALGPMGLILLDTLTVILLMGIVIAYNDAIRTFLQDTPLTTHSNIADAVFIAILITPLSIVPDLGYLTKTSAAGLSVLGVTMMVVAGYGIIDLIGSNGTMALGSSLSWLPQGGMAGVSQWFGCCVFGFGMVPLTFNFRESMSEPHRLREATLGALFFVAALYIVIGVGLLALYPNIEGDVLSELPAEGIIPVVTRLAMVVVVVATAPLLIVPCGEIIEGKFLPLLLHESRERPMSASDHRRLQTLVRSGICIATVTMSVIIPGFVGVLTFVGCFCVAFVSFCVPPCLHFVLKHRLKMIEQYSSDAALLLSPSVSSNRAGTSPWEAVGLWFRVTANNLDCLWLDMVLLVWGLTATGICTAYVFHETLSS
eukprot:Nitzschia sp. Nitz4//scaffold185_size43419//26709//28262//NITZ4_007304-RA/size43419-processed-gene-0.82-mRNA-1//-1//CDS//3329539718//7438//frame0